MPYKELLKDISKFLSGNSAELRTEIQVSKPRPAAMNETGAPNADKISKNIVDRFNRPTTPR